MPCLARMFSLVEYSLLSKMIGEFTFMCLVISKDNINWLLRSILLGSYWMIFPTCSWILPFKWKDQGCKLIPGFHYFQPQTLKCFLRRQLYSLYWKASRKVPEQDIYWKSWVLWPKHCFELKAIEISALSWKPADAGRVFWPPVTLDTHDCSLEKKPSWFSVRDKKKMSPYHDGSKASTPRWVCINRPHWENLCLSRTAHILPSHFPIMFNMIILTWPFLKPWFSFLCRKGM